MAASPTQRDIINDIKTNQALMKQDIGYIKKEISDQGRQLTAVADSIAHLAFAPLRDFQSLEERVKAIEDYNSKNRLGVLFSNDLVTNLLKFVVIAAAAALLIAAGKWLANGGGK